MVYSMSLTEISKISDINIKKQIIDSCINELKIYKKYNRILENIREYKLYIYNINKILNNETTECQLKLQYIIELINNELLRFISYDYFPNLNVILYPSIKELKSTKIITCHICGSIILSNNYYLSYRPLIEDLDGNNRYVLRNTIKCETAYYDILPKNILEFEDFNRKLQDEYYDISANLKSEELYLLRLKK